jgi:hypothetical protein
MSKSKVKIIYQKHIHNCTETCGRLNLEEQVNDFIQDKEVIAISLLNQHLDYLVALIYYKEQQEVI